MCGRGTGSSFQSFLAGDKPPPPPPSSRTGHWLLSILPIIGVIVSSSPLSSTPLSPSPLSAPVSQLCPNSRSLDMCFESAGVSTSPTGVTLSSVFSSLVLLAKQRDGLPKETCDPTSVSPTPQHIPSYDTHQPCTLSVLEVERGGYRGGDRVMWDGCKQYGHNLGHI